MPAETSPSSEADVRCRMICLTPTRNERWIINHFLTATRLWADNIIVADQNSTDGTLQRLQSTAGVDVVINESPTYDEAHRQRLLIDAARQKNGKRILIALDADEALSANCLSSAEWAVIEAAAPGTVLRFKWVNVLPGFKNAWIPPEPTAFGFVDDGSEHQGERIHSRRVPWPKDAPVIDLEDIVVLHFQYVAWDRMLSKQRWYQAWERVNHPHKSALSIFRQYHHMNGSWASNEIFPFKSEWIAAYEKSGVSFQSLKCEPITWWDAEIVDLIGKHGPETFRKSAIWDIDWESAAKRLNKTGDFHDPRSSFEKAVHKFLRASQKHRQNWIVARCEGLLRRVGW